MRRRTWGQSGYVFFARMRSIAFAHFVGLAGLQVPQGPDRRDSVSRVVVLVAGDLLENLALSLSRHASRFFRCVCDLPSGA